MIFFCENNLYAISTAAAKSHGQPDIFRRAAGYGMPGVIVDGQDATAVYRATYAAVERARRREGPTLVEAKTYRFDEHCTGLTIAIPYRTQVEIETYRTDRDPLILHRATMIAHGIPDVGLAALERAISDEVAAAVTYARQSPLPEPAEVIRLHV